MNRFRPISSRRAQCGVASALLLSLAAVGCARTTAVPQSETSRTGLPQPGRVLVYNFAVTPDEVTTNQSIIAREIAAAEGTNQSQEAIQIGRQVADALASQLVTDLGKAGLNAVRANAGTPIDDTDVLVVGHFLDVNEGNRLRRMVIGFGVGATTLDAEVYVYQQANGIRRALMEFQTHADSGDMPGAAVTMGAGAAAQGGVTVGMAAANAGLSGAKAYRSQIDQLASRSAQKATALIAQLSGREGWISPAQVESAQSSF